MPLEIWHKWVQWPGHFLDTLSLSSQLNAWGPPKVAFRFSKPQKGAMLLVPNSPSSNFLLYLPFVSFDKMFHLGTSCHCNSAFLSPISSWLLKGEPCVMGERKIYKKRKPGAQCSLGRDYSQTVVSEPCVCGQGDFEW